MIRNATEKDASRIAEILIFSKRVAYRSIFQNDKVSFGEMQVLPLAMEYIKNPELLEHIFVYDDEFVKGMINIQLHDGNSAEIKELYIDPFFQNQKIGSQLLEFLEVQMQNLGISNIFLWVLEKNDTARKFYEKHHFRATTEKALEKGTEEYIIQYRNSL
ncbi:MAG: GNAT family N-acetyltransferase [Ruminococcaceae bacterium]|jgi:putative acetyltransferase|nr:GNAT family N-acetyltransferase [Oscillospiraceae bacterium]